jgi:hypothetical protein
MFAPLVAKAQTKTSASSTNNRVHQPVALVAPRLGHGVVEEAHMLPESLGNQAMFWLLAQRASSPTESELGDQHEQPADPAADQRRAPDREAVPSVSWDISNLSVFPGDRSTPHQTRPPLAVPPLRGAIQPKLVVGETNDPLEQEADRIADQMLAAPAHPAVSSAPRQIHRVSGQPTG